jgi:hypothetical protein
MPEPRNLPEGILRWVQASGTGGWKTASAPPSGTFGYVQAGMNFQQQQQFAPYYNRGTAGGFKFVQKQPGQLAFKLLYGITADYPPTAITASGVSVPQIHIEFEASISEDARTGIYWQFMNCVNGGPKITEQANADEIDFAFQFLTYNGPTGSGYLGT